MTSIYAILYLILFGSVLGFVTIVTLGPAGLIGNMLAGKPGIRSKTQFKIGTIITALGQTYVYLSYTAFIVSWTMVKLYDGNAIKFLVWVFSFLAVMLPISFGFAIATAKEKEKGLDYANPLVEALNLVILLAFIGFFVFLFVPNTMQTIWNWVPYVGKLNIN